MRDFKFRFFDFDKNKMFYLEDLDIGVGEDGKFYFDHGFQEGFIIDWPDKFFLMQYTGLKDMSGKEIYEGDIVRGYKSDFTHEVTGIVEYNGMSFCFVGTKELDQYEIAGGMPDNYWRYNVTSGHIKQLPEIEIIGNIYENPELLTEKI